MIPPGQVPLSESAKDILAAPEIFRTSYEVSVKANFMLNLLILTVLYAIPAVTMFLANWPFPYAWLLATFCYPVVPWRVWFWPGLKMTRTRELALSETGIVVVTAWNCYAWKWDKVSLLGITNYGLLGVFERPPKLGYLMNPPPDVPSLRVPYHPSLRELYVKLAEGEIQLPEGVQFTYFDHPRILPAGNLKP